MTQTLPAQHIEHHIIPTNHPHSGTASKPIRYFFRPLVFLYPPPDDSFSPVLLVKPSILTHSGQNQCSGNFSGSSFMHFTWNCAWGERMSDVWEEGVYERGRG